MGDDKKPEDILKENIIPECKFSYEEDSFGIALEPKYFTVVDLVNAKVGRGVNKLEEKIAGTAMSQFFAEMGTRRSIYEKRGMEILGTIAQVVRSVITLLYDLKEMNLRIKNYDDVKNKDDENLRNTAYRGIKRIWMDEVDVKKGNGSINALSQGGLEFVTLRDAFMSAMSKGDIKKFALNDRVTKILEMRQKEFEDWKANSEVELRRREAIERHYLDSQVNSLKLYAQWATPYLKAAQKLSFRDIDDIDKDAELIQAFDQNLITLKIRGQKKFCLNDYYKGKMKVTYERNENTDVEKNPAVKAIEAAAKEKMGPYMMGVVDVTLKFRTKPAQVTTTQSGGVYRNFGKLNIEFQGYIMSEENFKKLEMKEKIDALKFIEGMVDASLGEMVKEIDVYLKKNEKEKEEKKEEKKKEAKKESKPLFDSFFGGSGKGIFDGLFSGYKTTDLEHKKKVLKKLASKDMRDKVFDAYNTFKKSEGLPAFP